MHGKSTRRDGSSVLSRVSGAAAGLGDRARRRPDRRRDAQLIETLEERQFLSTVLWDGGPSGTGTDFNSAVNWVGDVLPGPADDAVINTAGPTITLAAAAGVQSVSSSRALQINSGGNLTTTGTNVLTAPVTLMGGTATGGMWNFSGAGNSFVPTPSVGTLASVTMNTELVLSATSSVVRLSGTTSFVAARLAAAGANLQLSTGYTLNSLVSVEGAAVGARTITFAVGGNGTNTIGPSGIIRLASGCGGGLNLSNSSAATIVNNGLISAEDAGQTLTIQNSTFTNNAMVQLTGGTLTITPTNWSSAGSITAGAGSTLNFAATWSNTGTISVTGATLNLGGSFTTPGLNLAGFTRSGGTVNLTGTLDNSASTLTLNASTGTWMFLGGTINGGTINVAGGSILALTSSGGTLASVTVNSELLMDTSSARVLVSGTTSFIAARLSASGAQLQFAPGYTLNSLVSAEGAAVGTRTISFAVGGSGTDTIAPSGAIQLAAGCGGNLNLSNSSVATIVNNGLISAAAAGQTLTIQNSTFTNNAMVQLTAGTLTITPTNWSNAGSISAASGSTVNFAGAWSNTGTISETGAMLNLGGSFTTPGLNLAGFSRSGGTVNLTGTLDNSASTLTLDASTGTWMFLGGTINGGTINVAGGSILALTSSGGTLASVAVNSELLMDTSSARVTVSGTTSFIAARLSASGAQLQLAPGYTLNSLVSAEGATSGTRTISFAVGGSGTDTIGPSGSIQLAAGCGGNLNLSNSSVATIVNNGLISAAAAGQTLAILNSTFTNNAMVQLTAGTLTITPTNWSNAGSISAASGSTLNFAGTWSNTGTISETGATLNLGGVFATPGLNLAGFTRSGGTVNLTGTLDNSASTLTLDANTGTWMFLGGTINGGTINFAGGSILALTSSGGTLASVAVNSELLMDTNSARVLVSGTTSFVAARLSASGAQLQFAPGYTLNSLVSVEGAASGTRTISFAVGGSGTNTISPTGAIQLAAGCGGNVNLANSSAATIVNDGLISAAAVGQTLTILTSTFTNNAMVQLTAGTLTITPTNWTSAGSITAGAGSILNFAGAWSNTGTISETGATLNLGGTFTTPGLNLAGFTRSGGTVNLTGTLDNSASTLTLDANTGTWMFLGGTINGGTINFAGGSILALTNSGGTLASVAVNGELVMDTNSARVLVSGTTSFVAARLSASGAQLQLAPGYTLNSLVSAEGAASGTRTIAFAVGGTGTDTIGPSGVIQLAPGCGGSVNLSNSSVATIVNNGLISAAAAGQILTINNSTFTNNGTVQATAGTLNVTPTTTTNFSGGTLTGGSWSVATGATLFTNFGNVTTNAAAIILDGAGVWLASNSITANSGSLSLLSGRDFAAASAFSNSGSLSLSAGSILSGPGYTQSAAGTLAVTLSGTDPSTQVGHITVTGAASLDGTLSVTLQAYQPVIFSSFDLVTGASRTGSFSSVLLPTPLIHESYYTVYTATTARLEYDHALGVWTGQGADTSWFTAQNWARNTIPDATIDAYISLPTNPTIMIATGAAAVARSVQSDEAISISSGSLTLSQPGTINALLTISGGTATFNGSLAATSITLSGAGTLTGSGNVTVSTALIWAGGTMSGAGRTTVAGGGSFAGPVSSTALSLSRLFELAGPGALNSGFFLMSGGTVSVLSGGALTLSGTSTALQNTSGSNALLIAPGGSLIRTGAGTTTTIAVPLTDGGTVDAQQGTLVFSGGGAATALFQVDSGSVLSFTGGMTFNAPAAAVSGAGTVNFSGATYTFNTTNAIQATLGPVVTTLVFNAPQTFANLTLSGGTLSGTGNVTVTSVLSWTSGSMSGTGHTVIPVGGTLSLSTGTLTLGRVLDLSGMATASSAALQFNGGTFNSLAGATFAVSSTSSFSSAGGSNAFNNAGSFNESGAASLSVASGVTFNNTGTVTVTGGTLTLSGVVTQVVGPTLSGGAWDIVGPGSLAIPGAALTTIGPGATLILDGSGSGFAQANGITANQGVFTLTNGRSFPATSMNNSGALTIGPSATLTVSGVAGNSGSITLNGGTYQANGQFNQSVGGTVSISNSGTLAAVGGGGSSGTITLASGAVLMFNGAQVLSAPASITGSGSLTVAGGTLSDSAPVNITGAAVFSGGSAIFGGTFNATSISVQGASASFNAAASTGGLTLNGGTLDGAGALSISGPLDWEAGTMQGSGSTSVASSGTLTLASAGAKTLSRVLNNSGAGTWSGSDVTLGGGTFNNQAGGSLAASGNSAFAAGGGTNAFNNAGTFTRSGAGATTVAVPFNNSGQATVQSGTLALNAGGTQTAGITVQSGATLSLAGTHAFGAAANVIGAGALMVTGGASTFGGSVSVSGASTIAGGTATLNGAFGLGALTVSPGASLVLGADGGTGPLTSSGSINAGAHTLSVSGAYTQTSSGSLSVRMNGPAAGQFGRIVATGVVSLAGAANVTWGYNPAVNTDFNFVTGSSRIGTFSSVIVAQPGIPRSFVVKYDGTGVHLVALYRMIAIP